MRFFLSSTNSPPEQAKSSPLLTSLSTSSLGRDTITPNEPQSLGGPRKSWRAIREWRWELFTWTLGSSALVAIITLLLWYRNKPVDVWKSKVGMTAIIAALAQVAQSALLVPVASCIGQLKWIHFYKKPRRTMELETFDMASRGPEGSLRLLYRLPRLSLLSFAALTTILMLSFQTFIQQSLQTERRRMSLGDAPANLRRAVTYMPESSTVTFSKDTREGLNRDSEPVGIVDLDIEKSIRSSMSDEYRALSNVSGSCATADCTWPRHDTLAICTSFEDVWDRLEVVNDTVWHPFNRTTSTFTLPDFESRQPWPLEQHYEHDFLVTTLSFDDPFNRSTPSVDQEYLTDLADIYVIFHDKCRGPRNDSAVEPLYPDKPSRSAWKATMRLCVQTLDSTFNSTMDVRVVEEYHNLTWRTTKKDPSYAETHNPSMTGPCTTCTARCTTPPNGSNDTFCIDAEVLKSIGTQIGDVFNASALLKWKGMMPGNYIYAEEWTPTHINDIIGANTSTCTTGPRLGFNGFKNRVNNVAIAITNTMRNSASSSQVSGTAWETVPFVRLELPWLAMPAFLYIAVTALLIGTVFQSESSDAPAWKHTALGLLRSLDGESREKSSRDAKERAERSSMQLVNRGDFWKLENMVDGGGEGLRSRKTFFRWPL